MNPGHALHHTAQATYHQFESQFQSALPELALVIQDSSTLRYLGTLEAQRSAHAAETRLDLEAVARSATALDFSVVLSRCPRGSTAYVGGPIVNVCVGKTMGPDACSRA